MHIPLCWFSFLTIVFQPSGSHTSELKACSLQSFFLFHMQALPLQPSYQLLHIFIKGNCVLPFLCFSIKSFWLFDFCKPSCFLDGSSFILLACCFILVTFSHFFSDGVISLTNLSVSVPDSSESGSLDLSDSGPDSSLLLELLLGSGSGSGSCSGLIWTFFF